jgi:hypothetical protein
MVIQTIVEMMTVQQRERTAGTKIVMLNHATLPCMRSPVLLCEVAFRVERMNDVRSRRGCQDLI